MKPFKVKKGRADSTSDFWYDLTKGGYLNPLDILENKSDAKKVWKAIEIVQRFELSCEKQIEGFVK